MTTRQWSAIDILCLQKLFNYAAGAAAVSMLRCKLHARINYFRREMRRVYFENLHEVVGDRRQLLYFFLLKIKSIIQQRPSNSMFVLPKDTQTTRSINRRPTATSYNKCF